MLLPKPVIPLAFPALLLGACSAEPEELGEREILHRAERLIPPEPGQYRTITRLTAFEMPGADPQEAERIRTDFGFIEPDESERCLSRAEAVRGFLPLVEAMQRGNCTFSRFDTSEQRLDAVMQCEGAEGTMSDVSVQGEAGTQSSRLETSVVQRDDSLPGGELHFTLVVEMQRLGECVPAADAGGDRNTET